MRYAYLLCALALPFTLFAQEAIPVVATEVPTEPLSLLAWVVVSLATILGTFVARWANARAVLEKEKITSEQLTRKEKMLVSLRIYALEQAGVLAERDMPAIAKEVVTGGMSVDSVKRRLGDLGARLRVSVRRYALENFSVDLIQEVGHEYIDELVRWAADRVSPFPGRPTAEALVNGGAKMLLDHGIREANNYFNETKSGDETRISRPAVQ